MSGICQGRVVIVTGGGRGIGRGHALEFARQGAKVVVNDLGSTAAGEGADLSPAQQVVDDIKRNGGEAIVNGNDVSDWAGAKALIDDAVNTFGRLDVLINNAGILRDRMMVNMTEAEWDAVIKVHLKGTFAPSHHAAQYWRQEAKTRGAPVSARLIKPALIDAETGRLTDMREMDAMYEVLVEHFGDWTPAGTLVCINNLSAPGARIELDMIAAVPADK